MNTNDLPPTAKLAALIEAGRAANPDIGHGTNNYFDGKNACAIGFATLACGVDRKDITRRMRHPDVMAAVGFKENQVSLFNRVEFENDAGMSLDDICKSLREGELATVAA